MQRQALAALAAAACAVLLAAPASAQMPASAFGKPLPDAELEGGTVVVRVIAGAPDKPVSGQTVTLSGEGAERTARTNAAGRATFGELAAGEGYVARVETDERKAESDPFRVPDAGGLRLMLSTEPVGGGAAGGSAAGGAMGGRPQGMPDPRRMSGIPRPQQGDPPGRLTVRTLQGELSSTAANAPVGALVHLVGYGADGSVTRTTKRVPAEGRVRFDDLATDRTVAYYALSLFERDGARDRLRSNPVSLPPQVGVRLMLAGHGTGSKEPPIDDVAEQGGTGGGSVPPGEVVVRLVGGVQGVREVELVEVGDPDRAMKSPAGRPQSASDAGSRGMLEARFRGVPTGPDKVYAAQVRAGGRVHRSMPFQLSGSRGATIGLIVYNQLLLRFHLGGELDDELMWFDGEFALRNPTAAPYVPEDGRVTIPLPAGFSTAKVSDENTARVKVQGGEGFVWRGPVAPGRETFRAQFALPVEGGGFDFDMPLPHGAMNSQIILEKLPGMQLDVPQGARRETRTMDNGRTFTMLSGINIRQGKRLVMSAEGLPQRPVWRRYLRWGVGLVVTALLAWGLAGLFRQRRERAGAERRVDLEARRERLLDELAQLERRHKQGEVTEARYTRSRDNLRLELESVYAELGRASPDPPRKSP